MYVRYTLNISLEVAKSAYKTYSLHILFDIRTMPWHEGWGRGRRVSRYLVGAHVQGIETAERWGRHASMYYDVFVYVFMDTLLHVFP